MTSITIKDSDLQSLKGQVAVITGGSSGIGLATSNLLLDLGASVVSGDLNPPPNEHAQLSFVKTNVTSWSDLTALFDHAKEKHGRIDHVHANAGITGRTNYLDEKLDKDGKLLEPTHQTIDINLKAVLNTTALGLHHMRQQEPAGGSIVITASGSSIQRFRVVDYCTSKHAVLGFMRGMIPNLKSSGLPIRINAVAPNWTVTGIVPKELIESVGWQTQPPEAVARSVALLMADNARQGQLIFSNAGSYWEIEEALLKATAGVLGADLKLMIDADAVMEKILEQAPEMQRAV